jgi:calcium-dependent protein kinase
VLSNMRQFVKYSRFKQFALRVIIVVTNFFELSAFPHFVLKVFLFVIQALASTLNEEELADLKDQFDAIDVDKNGSISIEEMRHVSYIIFS